MKLSKKKLEQLKKAVKNRDEATMQLGELELQKLKLVSNAYNISSEYEQIRTGLQEKYGDNVQIDLKNGDIIEASNDLKNN